jgi:hypothetical protein
MKTKLEIGQQVKAIGYRTADGKLTPDEVYIVVEHIPELYDSKSRYTWPAYVTVKNSRNKLISANADRFIPSFD